MEKQRLAIVTGGTRGIGASISISLKRAGYVVAANYVNNDSIAYEFSKQNDIKVFKYDLSDFNSCIEFVSEVENSFSAKVDILINNAGITRDKIFHKCTSNTEWQEVMNANLNSCFNMCSAVIKEMRNREFGRIVNISSINGLKGQVGQVNYSAAKSGMLGLTRSLALESANKNITVNAIAPGYIKTEMLDSIKPEILNNIISQIPVKRLGNPEEVARLVLFLINDNNGFITGETISINGGQFMG